MQNIGLQIGGQHLSWSRLHCLCQCYMELWPFASWVPEYVSQHAGDSLWGSHHLSYVEHKMSPQQRGPPHLGPVQVPAYPTRRSTAEPEPCPSHLSCTLPIGSPLPWLSSSFCWRSLSEAPLSLGKLLPGQWVGVAGLPAPTQPHPELTHWVGVGKQGGIVLGCPYQLDRKGLFSAVFWVAQMLRVVTRQKKMGSGAFFLCVFSFCAEKI